ncbi:hypothetical protein NQ317_016644 [Molorchus minor]|uniref:Uncharacterized protein n=1 Tax=Molorchus minor TaxID=1323400 RepID=A0ABQ9ITL3_9CUCU|nr:hypothetical protein NQ317_016644 [Molorchus minor]
MELASSCAMSGVNTFTNSSYIEFDALTRLGISDYKSYIKKQLANDDIFFLNSCVVSKNIPDRIEADIDECISSKSYVDLQSMHPSVFNTTDIQLILDKVLTSPKQQQTIIIDSFVVSKAFVEKLSSDCMELVKEKANATVESGKYQQYQIELQASHTRTHKSDDVEEKVDKREERRKKPQAVKVEEVLKVEKQKTKSTKKQVKVVTKMLITTTLMYLRKKLC